MFEVRENMFKLMLNRRNLESEDECETCKRIYSRKTGTNLERGEIWKVRMNVKHVKEYWKTGTNLEIEEICESDKKC